MKEKTERLMNNDGDYKINIRQLKHAIMDLIIMPDNRPFERSINDNYIEGISDTISMIKVLGTELKEDGGR